MKPSRRYVLLDSAGVRQSDGECQRYTKLQARRINSGVHIGSVSGHRVRIVDKGYWNKLGNKLAGEKLVEYF